MIIKTKIPGFNGIRANTLFSNGIGRTDDLWKIEWFRTHGYTIEDESLNAPEETPAIKPLELMTIDELKEYMKSIGKGGYIGNTRDREKLLEKAKAMKAEFENETVKE